MKPLTLPVRASGLTEEQRAQLFAAAALCRAVEHSYVYVIDQEDDAKAALCASLEETGYLVDAGQDVLWAWQITPLGLQVVAEWYTAQALLLTLEATLSQDRYETVVLGW